MWVLLTILFALAGCSRAPSESNETADSTESPSDAQLEALRSLPYLEWVDPAPGDEEKSGVTIHDRAAAFQGWNLYPSLTQRRAFLIGMDGEVLHVWQHEDLSEHRWQHVELMDDGSLLVILSHERLAKLTWDSDMEWQHRAGFHHDVDIGSNGSIWAISKKEAPRVESGIRYIQKRDRVMVYSSEGKGPIRQIDLTGALHKVTAAYADTRLAAYLEARRTDGGPEHFDHSHVNTLHILRDDVPGLGRTGQLLVCARDLNLVAIVDPGPPAVRWSWGPGDLDAPHHPTILPNGHLLIFDNGRERGYSRLVEVDAESKTIVWEYRADPPEAFFTAVRGSSQRLPNGNILVTESDRGRVFEIDAEKRIVWEFFNPRMTRAPGTEAIAKRTQREGIYRMTRIPHSEIIATLLETSKESP